MRNHDGITIYFTRDSQIVYYYDQIADHHKVSRSFVFKACLEWMKDYPESIQGAINRAKMLEANKDVQPQTQNQVS